MKPVLPQSAHSRMTPAPLLENGDRLTQAEFHRRYEACPANVKAELIGGTVYMSSPVRRPHAAHHIKLSLVLALYEADTPGVEALDNATTILDERGEPQPDLALWILPECGGQSRENADQYIEGAPELVAEIAHSSKAIDLHQKREDYQRAGVLEYLVLCVAEQKLYWFHFPSGAALTPNRQGIARARVFPGLWIDVPALLARDSARLMEVIQQGLASRAHATFVRRLERFSKRRQNP